jgi:hypothetical protein
VLAAAGLAVHPALAVSASVSAPQLHQRPHQLNMPAMCCCVQRPRSSRILCL